MPPPPGAASAHDLPPACLLAVLSLLDFWTLRTTVPAVCRAWRDLCSSNADRLFRHMEIDFAREALPAPALYPEHVDAPFLDAAAVGRWLARHLPRLDELRLELRHSRLFQHPNVADLGTALDWTPSSLAALLALAAPKLVSLHIRACDDLLAGSEALGTLWVLSRLTALQLSDVIVELNARRLNAGLRHLRQLRRFSASCNMSQLPGGLDDLPQAVCTLPALTALHLDNQAGVCRWLPGLSQATSLQDLVVRNCGVRGMYANIGQLQLLTSIELAVEPPELEQPSVPKLPNSITCLSCLQRLVVLGRLEPRELQHVGCLLSLTHLVLDGYLDHNRMTNPHDLDPLSSLQRLQELSIVLHQLEGWPPVICALPALQRLDLFCALAGLNTQPAELGDQNVLPQCTWLDLSSNALGSLPDWVCGCTALQHLSVSSNRLEGLPDSLSQLQQLEVLNLSRNSLKQVPPVVSTLRSLRQLHLVDTPISSCGVTTLQHLPKLQRLVLGGTAQPLLAHLAEQLQDRHGRNVLIMA